MTIRIFVVGEPLMRLAVSRQILLSGPGALAAMLHLLVGTTPGITMVLYRISRRHQH